MSDEEIHLHPQEDANGCWGGGGGGAETSVIIGQFCMFTRTITDSCALARSGPL